MSGNFTYAHSRNISKLYPQGGTEIELLGSVADTSLSADGNLLWDATPCDSLRRRRPVHVGALPLDGNSPHNIRGIFQALYTF